jgi:glycosyltransferase involved in cell wall biosynthesis
MKFAIITHVQHIKENNQYFGYAPYIREMNIWLKYVDEVIIVAPLTNKELNPIHEKYNHSEVSFCQVQEFDITSIAKVLNTIVKLPKIAMQVYKAMSKADHIHLRCPGNMGLVGAVVQILFPKKPKTAKYAGNWDPNAKQPFTYKLQRWILSNTFLTKNMQVLVYGDWENQTKNIKPFFTATYSQLEVQKSKIKNQDSKFIESFRFLFVGTLSKGKQPLYAIQLVEELYKKGNKVSLELYGDGIMKGEMEKYIRNNTLESVIQVNGNQSRETILEAYQTSHFLILPSKSEGWPKVVAEAMFWSCIPIASPVSCVSYMMGNGSRGILLQEELNHDINQIKIVLNNQELYQKMASEAQTWSQQFTTDKFEEEIKKLIMQ